MCALHNDDVGCQVFRAFVRAPSFLVSWTRCKGGRNRLITNAIKLSGISYPMEGAW